MGVIESKKQALLIVGASGGVGAALLEYLSTRTELVLIPTYNKNKPSKNQFSWIHYDSNFEESMRSMLEQISRKFEISVVIDASGAYFASILQKSNSEEIKRVISTNLVAPLILAKNAQEFLRVGGKAIFLSSIVSTKQILGSSAYAASKAGLERGILALSTEFSHTGHAICGIRLGYMDYGMTYRINEKVRTEILLNLPEEGFIKINVLGEKILDLIRVEAREINGQLYEIK